MNPYRTGETVFLGNQSGVIVRRFGLHAVQVYTMREKLIMAGTFPDKPIGSKTMRVKEVWPASKINTISQQDEAMIQSIGEVRGPGL